MDAASRLGKPLAVLFEVHKSGGLRVFAEVREKGAPLAQLLKEDTCLDGERN